MVVKNISLIKKFLFFFSKPIFLIIISIFVILFSAEIYSKQVYDNLNPVQIMYEAEFQRTPYPYIMFKGSIQSNGHNEGGYNGIYPTKIKPVDEYRIFILGGSTVYLGTPSIAVLLMDEFQKNVYKNVKVYNFGVISAGSTQELITIVTEISTLSPDLIIQYDGANDLFHPLYYDPRPGYPFNFIAYETNPFLSRSKASVLNLLLYKSSFVRLIGEKLFPEQYINQFLPLNSVRKSVGYGTDNWRHLIADKYTSNIIKSSQISRAFGANFIAFFQPTVYNKQKPSKEELWNIDNNLKDYYKQIYLLIKNNMSQTNASYVNFIDLTNIFDLEDSKTFMDVMHIYQEKYPIVSHAIYMALINKISIPNH